MAKREAKKSLPQRGTRERVIEVARVLMQERGYNGFSYADIATAVGVSHVAVHHHFKAKADLGAAAMADYTSSFVDVLADIECRHAGAPERLRAFVELFARVLRDGDRVCLCGMLASEYTTLPEPVQRQVRSFFERIEAWLAGVCVRGRASRELRFDEQPQVVAASLLASLEGLLIAARTFGDEQRFVATSGWLVTSLIAPNSANR